MHVIDSRVLVGDSSFTKQWNIKDPAVLVDFLLGKCASGLNESHFEQLKGELPNGMTRPSIFSIDCYRFQESLVDTEGDRVAMIRNWKEFVLSENVDLFTDQPPVHISFNISERAESICFLDCCYYLNDFQQYRAQKVFSIMIL